jgi:hypothetical protein
MPRPPVPPPLPDPARRRRRALAVAACALAALAAGVLIAWKTIRRTYDERVAPGVSALGLAEAFGAVQAEQSRLGRRLTDAEGAAVVAGIHDAWGQELRYAVLDDATYGQGVYYKIVTVGPDGVYGTKDDDGITAQ